MLDPDLDSRYYVSRASEETKRAVAKFRRHRAKKHRREQLWTAVFVIALFVLALFACGALEGLWQ